MVEVTGHQTEASCKAEERAIALSLSLFSPGKNGDVHFQLFRLNMYTLIKKKKIINSKSREILDYSFLESTTRK